MGWGFEPPLPSVLNPGRTCEIAVDEREVFRMLEHKRHTWLGVRGAFEDETGRVYKSPVVTVNWEDGRIGW